ncbi:uncharacterized protein [Diadema setosum]|uniref:uncharacterized protein n=1 Tax=Diadema setosum TaxID=31175 RepID=UPI003B3A54FD
MGGDDINLYLESCMACQERAIKESLGIGNRFESMLFNKWAPHLHPRRGKRPLRLSEDRDFVVCSVGDEYGDFPDRRPPWKPAGEVVERCFPLRTPLARSCATKAPTSATVAGYTGGENLEQKRRKRDSELESEI